METVLIVVLFIVGIALVVKGGDVFVDAASAIAKALRIPTFVIGATIVSLATTMPEMIVSALAAADGKNEMAIGNAVGSVIANTGIIMATAMVAMTILCSRKKYCKQMIMLMAASLVLWLSSTTGELKTFGSVILFIIFLAFMILNVVSAKKEVKESSSEKKEPLNKKKLLINIVMFVVGAAAIVVGSRLMVDNGSEIAKMLGVPERIIAVTLIAIGTSLPELVTTITAIVKKESSLSIGNIIGANIIDLSLILPVCSLVSGKNLVISAQSAKVDLPVCFAFTVFAMVPILIKEKASRVQGILLLGGYAVYLFFTVF